MNINMLLALIKQCISSQDDLWWPTCFDLPSVGFYLCRSFSVSAAHGFQHALLALRGIAIDPSPTEAKVLCVCQRAIADTLSLFLGGHAYWSCAHVEANR